MFARSVPHTKLIVLHTACMPSTPFCCVCPQLELRSGSGAVLYDLCPTHDCQGIVDTGTSFIATSQAVIDNVMQIVRLTTSLTPFPIVRVHFYGGLKGVFFPCA
jgi:hypothetical protein